MSSQTAILTDGSRKTNPFSTRWVRRALPYQFPRGTDAARLVDQLRMHAWRGCILGPHGSGKSALLAALMPHIEQSGRGVRPMILHDGQRHLPPDFRLPLREDPLGVMLVDGYEQLSWRARRCLNQICREANCGLLITVHEEASASGFPVLFRTSPDPVTVQRLVDHHLPPHAGLIEPADVATAFRAHRGNIRETFFALYDLFECRRAHLRLLNRKRTQQVFNLYRL